MEVTKKQIDKLIKSNERFKMWFVIKNYLNDLKEELKLDFIRPKNFDEVGILIQQIEEYVNKRFEPILNEFFDENFKKSFFENRYESIRSFEYFINQDNDLDKDQKEELILFRRNKIREFLLLKNKFIRQILKELLQRWYFDNILSKQDINDLILLIDSWFLEFFDSIFVFWERNLNENKDLNIEDDKIYYWGVEENEIVSYNAFVWVDIEKIKKKISQLNNINLKNYILWFIDLVKSGKFDYDSFVKLEQIKVEDWKQDQKINQKYSIKFVFNPALIDPEFEIHLVESVRGKELKYIIDLSKKYYWTDYWMEKISFNFTEILLSWWRTSFVRVLWRSFPNDKELSYKYGKVIYLIKSRNLNSIERGDNYLSQLGFKINKNIFKNIIFDEVKYHEFGHSLFLESKYDSLLEELKATLFYFLYLYDKVNTYDNTVDEEFIKNVVYFVIQDFIKRLSYKWSKSSKKYWILSWHILKRLIQVWLVKLSDNRLYVDANRDKFRNFLENLKTDLDKIKEIYELPTLKEKKEKEEEFLKWLNEFLKEWEEFFVKNVKV